jgi:hypothetical protein
MYGGEQKPIDVTSAPRKLGMVGERRAVMSQPLDNAVLGYLKTAYAAEQIGAKVLQKGAELAGDTTTADVYRAHSMQTRGHLRLIAERLNAYGAFPPTAADARIRMAGLNVKVDLEAACTPVQVGPIAYTA